MDLRHHGGAFADRSSHALHRTGAHVTDREYTVHARLEWSGQMLGGEAFRLTGQHKPMRVEGHAAPSEPLRLRVRAQLRKVTQLSVLTAHQILRFEIDRRFRAVSY